MRIIIGATTFLLLTVFSVAYLYFSNLTVNSRSNDKALAEIPSDVIAVLEFPNDKSLYEIFKDYRVFDAITGKHKKAELSWLRSLLVNNKGLASVAEGQKVFLSFHPAPADSVFFLWLIPLKEDLKFEDAVTNLIKDPRNRIKTNESFNLPLIEIKNEALTRTFYLCIDKGIARGSFSRNLLLKSIDKKTRKIEPAFIQEINLSIAKNENALANLFIDHTNAEFLKPFFRNNLSGNFSLFNSFPAYSSMQLNFKSDALMFNGNTNKIGEQITYTGLFLHQQPVKNTIKKVMPSNTSNYIAYGLSDYNLFHKDLKELFNTRKELDTLNKQISQMTSETGIQPERDIKKLWGNEFTTLQLSSHENIAVIRVSNGHQLQFYLDPLSADYSDAVRKMSYDNLFYYYLGDPLKGYKSPFFAITDNLLIISNSAGTVQRFLNDYNANMLLHLTDDFIQFDQLVADQSNISFFMDFSNSRTLIRNLFKRDYADIFINDDYGLKDFYGLSYQMISNNDHFFTNFYTGYKSEPLPNDAFLNKNNINQ